VQNYENDIERPWNHNFYAFRRFQLRLGYRQKADCGKSDAGKMDWWREAKFGMFIHWGPSSVAGVEISWARETHPFDHPGKGELVPDAVYDALYRKFNPQEFDADALVRTAKQAGMKYIVFTAKHHDGFSNWPTKLSDYNIANTPFKRDICKELADAVHRHGLKMGWYYSTRDWTHPDYLVGDTQYYYFFNWRDSETINLTVPLTRRAQLVDFWTDEVLGAYEGSYTVNRLPPRSARLIRATPVGH
jgi:hypothetical protein